MKQNTISRRAFIISAGLGIGGVMTGIISTGSTYANINEFDKKNNAFSIEPNIWLEIRKDNTIIITIPRSELGQGVRTSFSMIAAEEMDADWNKIKAVNAQGDKKYGNQSTGGSTSIRTFWEPLRVAGAQARIMFIAAAAKIWNTSVDNCRTEKSFVYDTKSSRKLSYGELIETAVDMPVPSPDSIKLKKPENFTIIGMTHRHIDNFDIVTGKAIYGSDFKYEGMKYSVILRPEEIGGSLKSFDCSEAKSQKGFIGCYEIPQGLAVVAGSSYEAIKSSEKIKIEWNPGPISDKSSEIISKELIKKIGKLPPLPQNTVKETEFSIEVPLLAHSTMEPMNSFAHYQKNKCEIWTITQNPQRARSAVAKALDISEDNVTVNVLMSGGGFGRGHMNDFVEIAARISKESGYPIKFLYTKEDCIKNDFYRPFSVHKLKSGIDEKGNITGWIHKTASQGSVKPEDPHYDVGETTNLHTAIDYSIPNGPWRSVNNTQLIFANESMLDELSELSGKDPYKYRLNLANPERFKNVIRTVAERSDWNRKLPQGFGRGISAFKGYGSYAAHVVEVSFIQNKLKVEKIFAVVDCGIAINPGNIKKQFTGAAIDALSIALKSEITIKNGKIQQSGFHDFEWLTMQESPPIDIHIIPSAEPPGGIGEVGLPQVIPALCNAIYNATGTKIRKLPINKFYFK